MTFPSFSLTWSSLTNTKQQMSPNADPFGAFFNYAARCWTAHLGGAPYNFDLDDVFELIRPTSVRYGAWGLESGAWDVLCIPDSPLRLLVGFGSVSVLQPFLDRLTPNSDDGDRGSIVAAATVAIRRGNLDNFQALINHRNTAMAVQMDKMLEALKPHCLQDRPLERFRGPDEELLETTAACLCEEVLKAMNAAQETGQE